jgi:hypothetical protein
MMVIILNPTFERKAGHFYRSRAGSQSQSESQIVSSGERSLVPQLSRARRIRASAAKDLQAPRV